MTKNDPSLDLCGKHCREVYGYFVPNKNRGGRPKGSGGMSSDRKERFSKLWDERKKRVLSLVKKEGQTYHDFRKAAKMNLNVLMHTLRRLQKDGKVKREGWSKGARWSLA